MQCKLCNQVMNQHTSLNTTAYECKNEWCDLKTITRSAEFFNTHDLDYICREFANVIAKNIADRKSQCKPKYNYIVVTESDQIKFDNLDDAIYYIEPNGNWQQSPILTDLFQSESGNHIYRYHKCN